MKVLLTFLLLTNLVQANEPDSTNILYKIITTEIDSNELRLTNIKPGYYLKRIPAKKDYIDYNEIDWFYISKNGKVKQFRTADFEYCLMYMWWKQEPKEIYKQIKRNKKKFNELYFECSGQEYLPTELQKKSNEIIILYPDKKDSFTVELLFVKGGLIHFSKNKHGAVFKEKYQFIGK